MKRRSFLIGLSVLAVSSTTTLALWSPEMPGKTHHAQIEAGDLFSEEFGNIRLETLKRDLGFTGEVVPWPVMSPAPDGR